MDKIISDNELKQKIEYFNELCNPFGSADIRQAINTCLDADISVREFYEILEEYSESTGIAFFDLDINYVILDYILQMARNDIDSVIGYDFVNDTSHGEIYTYGNYMCSQYDYEEESVTELKFKLLSATEYQKVKMRESNWILFLLSELGIEIIGINED
jgi:hypothetical protein